MSAPVQVPSPTPAPSSLRWSWSLRLWLWLCLGGCTEAPYIPTEPPALSSADTADSGDAALPCSADLQPLTAAQFTVVNGTNAAATLLWRDGACQEAPYATISAGNSTVQSSYVGHVWVVRQAEGGALLGWFAVEDAGPFTVEVP